MVAGLELDTSNPPVPKAILINRGLRLNLALALGSRQGGYETIRPRRVLSGGSKG